MTDMSGGAVESDVLGLRELFCIAVGNKFSSQLLLFGHRSVRSDVASSWLASLLKAREDDPKCPSFFSHSLSVDGATVLFFVKSENKLRRGRWRRQLQQQSQHP